MTNKVNAIKCKKCNDIIASTHVHDFKNCKCKSVFVDGGRYYKRRGWPSGDPNDWFEEIEESDDPKLQFDLTYKEPML